MKYEVTSNRLRWPAGTLLTVSELAGCNIDALVAAGHLAAVSPKRTRTVVTAEEPDANEEQS